jgi:sarcosine oxidase, subunit alpha
VRSRTLNKSIGLAMVAPSLAQVGTEIKIRAGQGAMLTARIVPTPFYDPKNLRQRADAGA